MRVVACRTEGCGRVGIVRTVHDTTVAPGIISRPILYCAECGAVLDDRETAVRRPAENAMSTSSEAAVVGPPENRARRRGGR